MLSLHALQDGCSPLMLASRHGRVDAVKELVKDLKTITDKRITNTVLNQYFH